MRELKQLPKRLRQRENSASKAKKTDFSQSMNSPIDDILFLQGTIGNQAVQRLIESGVIQAKIKISEPGDIYEQQADRIAEQVMRMPEPPCFECKDEEEEMLQTKAHSGWTPEITTDLELRINADRGGGQPLPQCTRAFFEPRFRHDFSQVRVHTDSKAVKSAKSADAQAFTTGSDVVFEAGEYSPETSTGKRLLAHELTHVVQQRLRNAPVIQYKKTKTKKKSKIALKAKKRDIIIIKKDVRKASINNKKGIDEITSDFYKPLLHPPLTIGKFGCSLRKYGLTIDEFDLNYKLKDADFRVEIHPWSGDLPFSTVFCWISRVEFRAKLRQVIYIPNDFKTHPCTRHLDAKEEREKTRSHEREHEADNVSVYDEVIRKLRAKLLFMPGVGRDRPMVRITEDPDSFVYECKEKIGKKVDDIVKEFELLYARLSAEAAIKRDPHDKELYTSKLGLLEKIAKRK